MPLFPPSTLVRAAFAATRLKRSASVFLGLMAAIFLSACGGGGFSNLESLPVAAYVEKPGDFLGNTYAVRGQIDSQIQWDRNLGRILAVTPENGSMRLPVFVPESVKQNLHIGQRYEMRVRIEEGGLLYVEDLRKY